MSVIGSRIEETGTLIADGGGFALRRDIAGRWKLELHLVPVDHVEKRVRISGIIVAEGLIDVEALGPDIPTPLYSALIPTIHSTSLDVRALVCV